MRKGVAKCGRGEKSCWGQDPVDPAQIFIMPDMVLVEFHSVFKYLKGCHGAEERVFFLCVTQLVELAQLKSGWKLQETDFSSI